MTESKEFSLETTQEFHRRIALIVETVQAGVWKAGVHDLIGHATDFGFGQSHGVQTLVLKTGRRSAYLRLHWDTVLGDTSADRELVQSAIHSAITELG